MTTSHLEPKSFREQIELLKNRGMIFVDEARAEKYLNYIGYQRLSVYWNIFYTDTTTKEHFKSDIKFDDILNLYLFDRKLRVLFFEAAERIEICMKVLLSDALSRQSNNAYWYINAQWFKTRTDTFSKFDGSKGKETCNHDWVLAKINETINKVKKNNPSLRGFTDIKSTPIPSWELVDLLTFGIFSNILNLVNGEHSKEVYEKFSLPKKVLDNWLECVVGVRNICAHYGLLYRRSFSNTPISLSKSKKREIYIDLEDCKMTFYAQFFIFNYLIKKISPTSTLGKRVISLINAQLSNPLLSREKMGLPDDFEKGYF